MPALKYESVGTAQIHALLTFTQLISLAGYDVCLEPEPIFKQNQPNTAFLR